jgi:hypothetical protein
VRFFSALGMGASKVIRSLDLVKRNLRSPVHFLRWGRFRVQVSADMPRCLPLIGRVGFNALALVPSSGIAPGLGYRPSPNPRRAGRTSPSCTNRPYTSYHRRAAGQTYCLIHIRADSCALVAEGVDECPPLSGMHTQQSHRPWVDMHRAALRVFASNRGLDVLAA